MSELTKEWLLKTIAELEEERDAVPGVVNEDAAMSLAAMKIALASLEAEPVGIVRHIEFSGPEHPAGIHVSLYSRLDDGIELYTAPPAPVAPAGYRLQPISEYDAMCAAMLQGAAGNSPVIPDWQAKAEKMAELHGSSFVLFRNGESPQCADPTKVIISFTDEGLGHGSAAPQQEVKNG